MNRPSTTVCPLCKHGGIKVDQATGKLDDHTVTVHVTSVPDERLAATVSMRCPGSEAVCSEWSEVSRGWGGKYKWGDPGNSGSVSTDKPG